MRTPYRGTWYGIKTEEQATAGLSYREFTPLDRKIGWIRICDEKCQN